MGSKSTSNRKRKDTIYIPTPKQSIKTGGDITITPSLQDTIAEVCELSFQVKIQEIPMNKPGIAVTLVKIDTLYHVFVLGTDIGRLTPKQSNMVDVCGRLKVRYIGKIVKEKRNLYARFTRITR